MVDPTTESAKRTRIPTLLHPCLPHRSGPRGDQSPVRPWSSPAMPFVSVLLFKFGTCSSGERSGSGHHRVADDHEPISLLRDLDAPGLLLAAVLGHVGERDIHAV